MGNLEAKRDRGFAGDYGKARRKLGWEPKVKFQDLVGMMVDADLERLRKNNIKRDC